MKLITETLKNRFAQISEEIKEGNPLIIAKFFDPVGSATWYATEYNEEYNIPKFVLMLFT